MIAAVLGLVTAACGGGSVDAGEGSGTASYGDASDATTAPPTSQPSATTAPPVTTPSAAASSTTPASAASTRNVANRTERLDASGFFLVLVAGGATKFKTTDHVLFELTFENRSDHTLVHDSNQELRFALYRKLGGTKTEQAWSNYGCRPAMTEKPLTGILEVEAGERGSFVDAYPTKDEKDPAGDGCRVTPGEYLLVGVLDWCPDDALRRSEYNDAPYCDKEKVRHVQSAPLALTFV